MFTQIKMKEEPACYTFECTSELILHNEIIKVEVDRYEEICVKSPEIKSELESLRSGKSSFERCKTAHIYTKHKQITSNEYVYVLSISSHLYLWMFIDRLAIIYSFIF